MSSMNNEIIAENDENENIAVKLSAIKASKMIHFWNNQVYIMKPCPLKYSSSYHKILK